MLALKMAERTNFKSSYVVYDLLAEASYCSNANNIWAHSYFVGGSLLTILVHQNGQDVSDDRYAAVEETDNALEVETVLVGNRFLRAGAQKLKKGCFYGLVKLMGGHENIPSNDIETLDLCTRSGDVEKLPTKTVSENLVEAKRKFFFFPTKSDYNGKNHAVQHKQFLHQKVNNFRDL